MDISLVLNRTKARSVLLGNKTRSTITRPVDWHCRHVHFADAHIALYRNAVLLAQSLKKRNNGVLVYCKPPLKRRISL